MATKHSNKKGNFHIVDDDDYPWVLLSRKESVSHRDPMKPAECNSIESFDQIKSPHSNIIQMLLP